MKIPRHRHQRDFESNPYRPWYRRKRPDEAHARPDQVNGIVMFLISEHVEGFGEGKVAHHIKGKPCKVVVGNDRK